MDLSKKISKIESLSRQLIVDLIINLVSKIGYENIDENDTTFVASFKGPITTDNHGFIYFEEHLTGNVDLSKIIEKIKKIKNEKLFSTTFIISNFNISKGFRDSLNLKLKNETLIYLGRDEIIDLIEQNNNDYWKHDNLELLDYEKNYCTSILQESELKSLKIFSDKYQKLLDIFIEPKIIHFYEDKETQTPTKKAISVENIIKDKKPLIISGEAGMGKSTLLKRIGELIIQSNVTVVKKNLPLFISATELFDSNYDILKVIELKLLPFFGTSLNELFDEYYITLLIDSIDEFEFEHQESVIKQVNDLYNLNSIRFILATRITEKSVTIDCLKSYNTYSIERFNNKQIEMFVNKFFYNQNSRAEKLLEALKENRIIEKLPVTPLSLSLISILFEENDLEIPATITDIYENFNYLLLGRAMVTSRIEFIDISFKERILSIYALEILKRKEHYPMTLKEFVKFFSDYYQSKTLPLKKGTLEDVLLYLVNNTGIVYLKNNTYVCFNHDSFMEYYASVEIFKHQRLEQDLYVNNFFDMNWQNSAVFYAGHSKDMPDFLKSINQKLKDSNKLNDYFSGISGAGYILQALFQTDNMLRKDTVDVALELNIRALELFIKLSSDDQLLFKSFRLPIIWLINLMFFFENFNSGTLREPLKLSFNSVIAKYLEEGEKTTEGYKALMLALTLHSNRINEEKELDKLIFHTPLLNDNILTIISEISINMISNGSMNEIKKEIKKEFKKIKTPLKHLLGTPASKLRFSEYDMISSSKKIKIVTEGKTDSEIIEHAYIVLADGEMPYWKIKPAGNISGGSHEVNKTLISSLSTLHEDEIIIGIFDHDEAGLGDFNRLPKFFNSIKNNTIKKHENANIYALVLPIPGEKDFYFNAEQKYNYFEIEHYFSIEFLSNLSVIRNTPFDNVFSIIDNKKPIISKEIRKLSDVNFFKDFLLLFELIDDISGIKVKYLL